MNKTSTVFLQTVVVALGIGAFAFLLWEPHVEGVNKHATILEIYMNSFVMYAYIASIPFFVALYQVFKVLGYAGQNQPISQEAVRALRTIRKCALAMIGFVAVSGIFMIFGERDDRPAGLFMRILIAFPSVIVVTAAVVFERILQNAVDLKSENDLTV